MSQRVTPFHCLVSQTDRPFILLPSASSDGLTAAMNRADVDDDDDVEKNVDGEKLKLGLGQRSELIMLLRRDTRCIRCRQ